MQIEAKLSDLIGSIYDCTIEPDLWPRTIGQIAAALDCFHGALFVLDLQATGPGSKSRVNLSVPELMKPGRKYPEFGKDYYLSTPAFQSNSLDEPIIASRHLDRQVFLSSDYYREWVKPQGISDAIQSIVMRSPSRLGVFTLTKHESVGEATDREIDMFRLLTPHIRRAVTISDLLDMQQLQTRTLAATLDALAIGIAIVGEEGRILHANGAARQMFDNGGPIRSDKGLLRGGNREGSVELQRAIAIARSSEVDIGAAGIGIPLTGPDGEAAVAHVLPLAYGDLSPQLVPQAKAAVFVAQSGIDDSPVLTAVAGQYKLTVTETRMLSKLATGATLADTARTLGIADSTAKTHLSHIFAKTGTSRQAELVALIGRLTPPLRGPTH